MWKRTVKAQKSKKRKEKNKRWGRRKNIKIRIRDIDERV